VNDGRSLPDALFGLARPLLLAFDVDGTLSPIVRNPDEAAIPESTMATLRRLQRLPSVELALITGRDLASLRRMEQLEGIWRAVEHGGVVLAPGQAPGERELTPSQQVALDQFTDWARQHARDAFVEYKPQAVALHVRGIAERDPERAAYLLGEADALATKLGLHIRRGKALREAEAVTHDKGSALQEIAERSGAASVFFVGDDLTDFPAVDFAVERGIGAFVRSDEQRGAPSSSAFVLESVDELADALQELLGRMTP
jgi:trehalose 6-phosphate phosphatase